MAQIDIEILTPFAAKFMEGTTPHAGRARRGPPHRPGLRVQGLRGRRRRLARDHPRAPQAHLPQARRPGLGRAPRQPARALAQDARQGRADRAAPGRPRRSRSRSRQADGRLRPRGADRAPAVVGRPRRHPAARLLAAKRSGRALVFRTRPQRAASQRSSRSATFAGVKPNSSASAFSGALAPKRSMPMTSPSRPTNRHHSIPRAASIAQTGGRRREDGVALRRRLGLEALEARHRDEPRLDPLLREQVDRGLRERHLGAGREDA